MRFVLAIILSLTFAFAAAGCGGGNACEDACEKLKSCANALNCTAGDLACGLIKSTLGAANCSGGGSSGDCTGANKDAADKINSCSLDDHCACK